MQVFEKQDEFTPEPDTYRGDFRIGVGIHPMVRMSWTHVDYDGPEDTRHGYGQTWEDCTDEIDQWIEENMDREDVEERNVVVRARLADIFADGKLPRTAAGWDEVDALRSEDTKLHSLAVRLAKF